MMVVDVLMTILLLASIAAITGKSFAWAEAREQGKRAAREALEGSSRIHIDSVLATHTMPRKARKALERRRAELLAEEIVRQ